MRHSAMLASLLAATVLAFEVSGQETNPPGTPNSIDSYVRQLKTGSAEERAGAAYALASCEGKSEAVVPALRDVLKEENAYLRSAAAYSLWKINKDPAAVGAYIELVNYKADSPISVPYAGYRGCQCASGAPLWDPNSGVRRDAAYYLGCMGADARSAIPALIKALQDRDGSVPSAAALALWRIDRRPEAIPALISFLKQDETSRWYAARALGEIGPEAKSAVPALVDALTDKEVGTRIQAAVALSRVDEHPRAIPALLDALKDPERERRMDAAEALGTLGPAAQTAVPALIEALHDPYAPVCDRAAKSLKKIDPEAAKQ